MVPRTHPDPECTGNGTYAAGLSTNVRRKGKGEGQKEPLTLLKPPELGQPGQTVD